MRRLVLIILAIMFLFTVPIISAAADNPLVVVTIGSHVPVYEYAAAAFEKQYGIPVQIVSQAYDQTHEVIVTAAVGKSSGFDVAAIDTCFLPNYAVAGIVQPLTDFAPEDYFKKHTESSMGMMTYNGVPYALGGGYNYKYFYYNEEMLRKGGFDSPPKTWNELVEISKALQEKNIVQYGIAWGWAQTEGLICDYTLMLNAFGGQYFDSSNELVVDSQEALDALQFMYDTIYTYGIADPASTSLTDREVMSLFLNGDVAFVLNWDFGWTWSQDPAKSKVVDVTRLGLIPGTDKRASSTTGGGSAPAILTTSKQKDIAWKFIETFNSPEVQMAFLTELKSFRITLKELLERPELQEKPYSIMFEQQSYAYPRAKLSWYPQFSSALQTEIHRALTKSKSAEQALKDAETQIQKLVSQFGGF